MRMLCSMITCDKCGGKGKVLSADESRALRLAKGVTLQILANAMGVSKAYLCDLETGHRLWNGGLEARLKAALKKV